MTGSRRSRRISRRQLRIIQGELRRPPEWRPGGQSGSFLGDFLRNLVVIALILGGMALFVTIFYPETWEVFAGVGFVITLLKFWPIVILGLLISAIPRRRR